MARALSGLWLRLVLKVAQHIVACCRSADSHSQSLDTHALKEPVVNGIGVGSCSSAACHRIPGADTHTAVWASIQGRPMCAKAIYDAIRNRTKKAFGFGTNLHRFRHAAASFWSI